MNIDRYRIRHGDASALRRISPADMGPFKDKEGAHKPLRTGLKRIDALQRQLYANDRYSVLLVFQGMDAAGKDSAISHVLSGVNPQGTEVHSFKRPSDEELSHDFLWRAVKALPARGRIGIFNRSYYEDVGVVRVHPKLVAARRLPADRVTKHIWRHRFEDIETFERHLSRSGTIVCKFFLHVSREKQRERLLKRIADASKHWKFDAQDLVERGNWRKYQTAYGEAIAATSHAHAPWYIVPADHKWFTRLLVSEIIVRTLSELTLTVPPVGLAERRQLDAAARALQRRR
jgi:PPK2 family polyphosphate:nucleotide phosphotransferase